MSIGNPGHCHRTVGRRPGGSGISENRGFSSLVGPVRCASCVAGAYLDSVQLVERETGNGVGGAGYLVGQLGPVGAAGGRSGALRVTHLVKVGVGGRLPIENDLPTVGWLGWPTCSAAVSVGCESCWWGWCGFGGGGCRPGGFVVLVSGGGVVGQYVYAVALSRGQGAVGAGVFGYGDRDRALLAQGCFWRVGAGAVVAFAVSYAVCLLGGDGVRAVVSVLHAVFDDISGGMGDAVPGDVQCRDAGGGGVVSVGCQSGGRVQQQRRFHRVGSQTGAVTAGAADLDQIVHRLVVVSSGRFPFHDVPESTGGPGGDPAGGVLLCWWTKGFPKRARTGRSSRP